MKDAQKQIENVIALHQQDIKYGFGEVYIPEAPARKYPRVSKGVGWRYVFPSKKLSEDPCSGKIRRHYVKANKMSGLFFVTSLITCKPFHTSYRAPSEKFLNRL